MKLSVLILGHGRMGHAMEHLLGTRHDVRIWDIDGVVKGSHATLEDEVAEAQVVLFCLPVNPHHEIASRIDPLLTPDSLCLTIAKGLDESGRTAAQVFDNVFSDKHRYGVMYGPMIAEELSAGQHGFADVVLSNAADMAAIESLFRGTTLVCQQATDMHGRSWSVILKNVYAILFGVADELKLGMNMRGHMMVGAMAELSGIVQSFGGQAHTSYSYAGLGDLVTTGTSEDSHHHTLGRQLVRGEWSSISGEGVHTLQMVEKYRPFDWRGYPLFALAHDIVTQPATLRERVEDYLKELRELESCAI
jgi:glycerol-3-phosphate dehydrogenase (NAD(P)+)